MVIEKSACAGTLESSDVFVEMEPLESGLRLEIDSVVFEQFGDAIERVAREVLEQFDVTAGKILLRDRGALEYTIRARIETALKRAQGGAD